VVDGRLHGVTKVRVENEKRRCQYTSRSLWAEGCSCSGMVSTLNPVDHTCPGVEPIT
jgi:hypothetical protein